MRIDGQNDLKVAVIEMVGGHGGMNFCDLPLCQGIARAGVKVTLFTCDETDIPEGLPFEVKRNFRRIWRDAPLLIKGFRFLLGLTRSLRDAKSAECSAVYYHFFHGTLTEWLSVGLAKSCNFKVIITAHDVESFRGNTNRSVARQIYRACHRVIAHSQISREELIKNLALPESKIRVIPSGNYVGFAGTHLGHEEAKRRLNLHGEGPFILFFGQIKEVKGLDLLLLALPCVLKGFPQLRLIIARKESKNDFDKYKAMRADSGIEGNVIEDIRYIPDELVGCYYRCSDLVVLPYRRIYNSAVLLMAMSYGRAVLVSDLPGNLEVIEDDVNGFVFKTGDSEDLARKLIEILFQPGKIAQVDENGHKTVLEKHDWDDIGRQTARVYRELI